MSIVRKSDPEFAAHGQRGLQATVFHGSIAIDCSDVTGDWIAGYRMWSSMVHIYAGPRPQGRRERCVIPRTMSAHV